MPSLQPKVFDVRGIHAHAWLYLGMKGKFKGVLQPLSKGVQDCSKNNETMVIGRVIVSESSLLKWICMIYKNSFTEVSDLPDQAGLICYFVVGTQGRRGGRMASNGRQ